MQQGGVRKRLELGDDSQQAHFSKLRNLRKLACHVWALSLKALSIDELPFTKFVSGDWSLKNYSTNTQPKGRGIVTFLPRIVVPVCLYSFIFGDCSRVPAVGLPSQKNTPPYLMGSEHLDAEKELSQCAWDHVSHSLTQSQSTIGFCQKGGRCHQHLPCFFTKQANLNIATTTTRPELKQLRTSGKWQGGRLIAKTWAEGRGRWVMEMDFTGSKDTADRPPVFTHLSGHVNTQSATEKTD